MRGGCRTHADGSWSGFDEREGGAMPYVVSKWDPVYTDSGND